MKLRPSSTVPPIGNEDAPIVRILTPKKYTQIYNGPLAGSAFYNSPWFDTTIDGHTAISVLVNSTAAFQSVRILQTEDVGLANASAQSFTNATSMQTVCLSPSGQLAANIPYSFTAVITARYWKVIVDAASVALPQLTVGVTSSPHGVIIAGSLPIGIGAPGALGVAVISGAAVADGATGQASISANPGLAAGVPAIMMGWSGGAAGVGTGNFVMARTPQFFQNAVLPLGTGFVPGYTTSTALTKPRLMKYKIEVGEDCTLSAKGPAYLSFTYPTAATSAGAGTLFSAGLPTIMHRIVIPATALATAALLWDSDWIDLGNGFLGPIANSAAFPAAAWLFGINTPAPASPITPTFTLPTSANWQVITLGFTTRNNEGCAILRSSTFGSAGTGSAAMTAISPQKGNLIVVFVRSTNSATGTPVLSISDTAGNVWSKGFATDHNDSHDGAHGSNCNVFWCFHNGANASADVITIVGTNSPADIQGLAFEYPNVVAVDATAAVVADDGGTAGTTATSASYTPTSVGDLLLSCFFSSSTQSSAPTVATFFMRLQQFTAQGSMSACDNWGNGALTAGAINLVAVGTNE